MESSLSGDVRSSRSSNAVFRLRGVYGRQIAFSSAQAPTSRRYTQTILRRAVLLAANFRCLELQSSRTVGIWGHRSPEDLPFGFILPSASVPPLDVLRKRIADETPEYDRFGIHTMVSQSSTGELTLGDSHDYGLIPAIFNREEIDQLMMRHLQTFLGVPDLSIAERWYGVYAKHFDKPYIRFRPEDGIEVITGLGGAGMTLSFGVAAETFSALPYKEVAE